jgi:hypothetical protein
MGRLKGVFLVCQAAGASLMLLVSNTSDCLVMRTSDEAVAHNLSSLYAISVDADVTPLFLSPTPACIAFPAVVMCFAV